MRHCDRSVAPKRADPNAISAGHATGTDYSSDYCAVWCYPYCVTSAVTAVLSVLRDQCCAVLALHSTVLPVVLVRYSAALSCKQVRACRGLCSGARQPARLLRPRCALSSALKPFALSTVGHHESAVPQCRSTVIVCRLTAHRQCRLSSTLRAACWHCSCTASCTSVLRAGARTATAGSTTTRACSAECILC